MVDVDAYRDANAYLHRNVVRDDIVKIEWETPPLNNTEMQAMLAIIKGAMTNSMERKVTVTCYDDYNDTYQTGDFYVPDITFTPYRANATEILYMPTRIALTKY